MLSVSRFNGVVENAFEEKAPHKICAYIEIQRVVTHAGKSHDLPMQRRDQLSQHEGAGRDI